METKEKTIFGFNEIQKRDSGKLIQALSKFIEHWKVEGVSGKVSPGILPNLPDCIVKDPDPIEQQPLDAVIEEIYTDILPYVVKSSHPLFLGYVTPPTLDISWLGNAIIAMLNQNVSFASLSPAGTAIEQYVIRVLCRKIIGYTSISSGIFVSGGSAANLQALLMARSHVVGEEVGKRGNYVEPRAQRIYCSAEIHRSIHKAAMLMGIGVDNVVSIPCDANHKVRVDQLQLAINKDKEEGFKPIAIIGAAGTRVAGSFDDFESLAEVAEKEKLWFHIDGAYGACLRLASNAPKELRYLNLAHSVTLDPHKLLFMPFDSGCILVRDRQSLLDTFATEGEYLEKYHPIGSDYCDYGMQLGRSMKSFNVWLALKYFGLNTYKREYERLLSLATEFRELIQQSREFELVGPGESIVVCFRLKINKEIRKFSNINDYNYQLIMKIVRDGGLFMNKVMIDEQVCLRVCLANYRTTMHDLKIALDKIKKLDND